MEINGHHRSAGEARWLIDARAGTDALVNDNNTTRIRNGCTAFQQFTVYIDVN
jgi:hypothetical protein